MCKSNQESSQKRARTRCAGPFGLDRLSDLPFRLARFRFRIVAFFGCLLLYVDEVNYRYCWLVLGSLSILGARLLECLRAACDMVLVPRWQVQKGKSLLACVSCRIFFCPREVASSRGGKGANFWSEAMTIPSILFTMVDM